MFNLLVGIDDDEGSLPRERVLVEYTSDEIRQRFLPDGELSQEVVRFPALVMPELGQGSEAARIGRLLDVKSDVRGSVSFKVRFDEGLLPIPLRSGLWDVRSRLGIADFEFSRTHWALKDADLFEVLLRHHLQDVPKPRVLGVERLEPIDPEQVSVMIRFRADFDAVFETIKAVAHELGFKCHRVKDIWENDAIVSDIARLIMRSRVVIADLTDRNANVFYEYGLAHGMGREVIPITQDAADNFDVQHLRHVLYENSPAGREKLAAMLRTRLEGVQRED